MSISINNTSHINKMIMLLSIGIYCLKQFPTKVDGECNNIYSTAVMNVDASKLNIF